MSIRPEIVINSGMKSGWRGLSLLHDDEPIQKLTMRQKHTLVPHGWGWGGGVGYHTLPLNQTAMRDSREIWSPPKDLTGCQSQIRLS